MRAMVYRGPYKVRVEEKEIPPIEHPNDAIVRVTKAAIAWPASPKPMMPETVKVRAGPWSRTSRPRFAGHLPDTSRPSGGS